MNRVILAISVIVGIAVMLSMSTLGPAFAEENVAFCSPRPMPGLSHSCNKIPAVNDHIHFVLVGFGFCGGDVFEIISASGLLFISVDITHSAGPCGQFSSFQIIIEDTL